MVHVTLTEFLRKKGMSPALAKLTRARFHSWARAAKKLPAPIERRDRPQGDLYDAAALEGPWQAYVAVQRARGRMALPR